MPHHVPSTHLRRCLLAIGLSLSLLWLLSGVLTTTQVAQARSKVPAYRLALNTIITVTNADDDGPGSLRQAINNAPEGSIITFDHDYAIYLSSTLNITRQLTIDGGQHVITVSGDSLNNGTQDVPDFFITSTVAVTLSHLNIISGTATQYKCCGAGVYVGLPSRVTIQDSTIAGNSAFYGSGGIYNEGTLLVQRSLLSGNSTADTYCGGAICNYGALTVTDSTLSGNKAHSAGGGITSMYGTLAVQNSTFSGNSSRGGGGIANYYSTVTIENSTFISNSTVEGGGIINIYGIMTVTNSTIVGNSATYDGGGVFSWSGENVISTTLGLVNTIIAHNTGGDCITYAPLTAHDHNVIADASNACGLSNGVDGNIIGQDPRLGSLADNGGSTWTMALTIGSPAMDAGSDVACPSIDQRGFARPRGTHCDIGAYEFQSNTRYVATSGDDASNLCLDSTTPCATIQHAIDVATDGDQVLIASGLYTQSSTLAKAVSLIGAGRDTTILHAVEGQRVLTITGATITNSVVISGLTFTGGEAQFGGGIYADAPFIVMSSQFISNSSSWGGGGLFIAGLTAVLSNNVIISNTGTGPGGGVYLGCCTTPVIYGNLVAHNTSDRGGGLFIAGTAALVSHNVISANTASTGGGGMFVDGFAGTLIDNTFADNMAGQGGGLWIYGGWQMAVAHNLFVRNHAQNPAVGRGGAIVIYSFNSHFDQNRFVENTAQVGGGAIWAYNGGGGNTLVNSLFIHNSSADGVGNSIYDQINSLKQLTHLTLIGTGQGSGIYASNSTLYNLIVINEGTGIDAPGSTLDGVLWYSNTQNTSGGVTIAHEFDGDPRFVDPAHDDYQLLPDSPAIDRGVDAGIYTDLDGQPRPIGAGFDIGAYEYQSGPRYVATTGDDASNPCFDSAAPCATVQHAIDVANDGDQVFIASGIYTQSSTLAKAVSLMGAGRDTTILHAVEGQRVLTITGATISNSIVISGLTFTGGDLSTGQFCPAQCGGGGIYSDAPLTVMNSCFISNTANLGIGGGLYALLPITLSGVEVSDNFGRDGGGVFAEQDIMVIDGEFIRNQCEESRPPECIGGALAIASAVGPAVNLMITGTRFISNSAMDYNSMGGAIFFASNGTGQIVNAVFANNSAGYGTALFLNAHQSTTILNSTIGNLGLNPTSAVLAFISTTVNVTNTIISNHLYGIQVWEGWGSTVTEDHNLFFGNSANTVGVVTGTHSLIGDPRFVDPLHDDYHLQFGSAAIDHGVDAGVYTDLDGQPRPIGAGFDIGAYEYQFAPSTFVYLPVIRR